ncbi:MULTISPECIES: LysM peptidoglycan-binding domain-containing protein [Prevotella]|nr:MULTISPECIES: LysM peptidoglycan-binding domain-containing protein [Prevotella]
MRLIMSQIKRYFVFALFLISSFTLLAQSLAIREQYKVKRKDTIYGIAKKFDVSISLLMEANPQMKQEGYELHHGDYILIPRADTAASQSKGEKTLEQKKAVSVSGPAVVTTKANTIKVGIMLPLHNVDGDGKRMIEYYRGLLIACDSLKTKGISTELYAWNAAIDMDINSILKDPQVRNCDIIFGPLYSKHVTALAQFCKSNHIKLVIPFSISGNDVDHFREIYQIYQSPKQLVDKSIEVFVSRFKEAHPVFIDCNDTTSNKASFTFGLRKQLEKLGIAYSITNLKSSEENFAKAFQANKRNVVILNTGRSPQLTVAINKLEGLLAMRSGLLISLYGYTEWLMYTKYNIENFHKFDTYIPSTFYYNPLSKATANFERNYRRWFQADMQYALPRFALMGYDQASFFLQGIRSYGKDFVGSKAQNRYRSLQAPFHFSRVGTGGYQNDSFLLVHYRYDDKLDLMEF